MGTAYDHGYESLSGFHDAFAHLFGETPGSSSAVHVVLNRVLTPLGPLIAGATDEGLCMLEFAGRPMLENQIKKLRKSLHCAITPGTNRHIEQLETELAEYFAGERTEFNVVLRVQGTDFQQKVWRALEQIPYGETRSYEEIARVIDNPKAVRAVGRANGANPIPIVIPCHRVVRADGSLGGYGGELWRKRLLLKLEGHDRYAEEQESLPLDRQTPTEKP